MSEPTTATVELQDTWPLAEAERLRDELLTAYADPVRGYHDLQHLGEVVERLAELSDQGAAFDWEPVLLAAWFHDGVYDGERDAEERSATWAEDALAPLMDSATVTEVARLVRMTETHRPETGDANGSALSDADLAILAAPTERYEEYVQQVRQEFAHIDDALFTAGRAAVLRELLSKENLFSTDYGQRTWEADARHNVEAELAELAGLAGPTGSTGSLEQVTVPDAASASVGQPSRAG
ncbi:hypothetical protein GCM10027020_37810 [Nocardioides salsibiostraticola]